MLEITTRPTLAELSGELEIDGSSRRVMSHGNGFGLSGMCLKKDLEGVL